MTRNRGPGPLFVAVLALVAFAGAALAAPTFPRLTGRVVDEANLLSPEAERSLTARLKALEDATGRQMVVATIPDLQGYPIEDYGYQLGRTWGIGDAKRDDGVLLIVAPNDRKVRIEVGYGLEPILTDSLSSVIIQTRVLPAFRSGDMEAGIIAGAEAVATQLALPEGEAKANVRKASEAAHEGGGSPLVTLLVLILIFWVLASVMRGGGRSARAFRRSGLGGPVILPPLGGGWRGGDWGGGGFGGGGFGGGGGGFGGGGSSGSW
ncbi:MAG: hypothetical protein RL588_585 [Pseudomonadota bacterium]|jgi:uncharacterized protein